jgi:hypothetical protein
VNHSSANEAIDPSLTSIAGVPWIAWSENDGTNTEIRVAHLDGPGTDWVEVGPAASPVNASPAAGAEKPNLINFGGVPHVVWTEDDAGGGEVRVARLNGTADDWDEIVGGSSPINHSAAHSAYGPTLFDVDGGLWVSWQETNSSNSIARVARLNAAGSDWQEVVGGESPINDAPDKTAQFVDPAVVGGIPFVAWGEELGAANQIRVARLEPDVISQTATDVGETGANLSVQFNTYGLDYPLGIQHGTGLEQQTPLSVPAGPGETATVNAQLTGLSPTTTYSFRGVAQAGLATPLVLGPTATFQTATPPAPPDTRDTLAPDTKIDSAPKNKLTKRKATYAFSSTEPGSTFRCTVDKAPAKPCSSPLKLKRLKDGKHTFAVVATDAAGNTDASPATDRFKVRKRRAN